MNNEVQTTPNTSPARGARAQEGRRDTPAVTPPVDVFENDTGITVLADMPGVSRDRLHVRVDGDTLWLEAEAAIPGPEGMELVYAEARVPAYRRAFTLSRELDASKIEASLKDGVLRVAIPKLEEARPRRIEVRAG